MTFRFQYSEEPSLRETIGQAIGFGSICWSDVSGAGVFDVDSAVTCHDAALAAVRDIVTFQLAKLLDVKGQAQEWNAAIEQAIKTVEEMR